MQGERDLKRLSGKGEILSYTQVTVPAEGFEEQSPYHIALIKLDEGPIITAQLTDLHSIEVETTNEWGQIQKVLEYPELKVGMKVEMVTRKLKADGDSGIIVYGYKFRPEVVSPQVSEVY